MQRPRAKRSSHHTSRSSPSAVAVAAAAIAAALSSLAAADELPPGTIGAVVGAQAGTSGSYTSLGVGAAYGLSAAWQPIADDKRVGWGVRCSVLFGYFPDASSAPVSGVLRLVELDLVARLRIAPTARPGRYLTAGLGASLLRSNEPIKPDNQRAFAGPIATFGYEHNAWGSALLGIDVRYGIIETGPTSIGLLVFVGTALR